MLRPFVGRQSPGCMSRKFNGTRSLAERPDSIEAARQVALRLLERRRRTRSDLSDRLVQGGFAEGTVEVLLDRLERVGLVDDLAYAEAFVRWRKAHKPRAKRLLLRELRHRGVPPAVAQRAVEEPAEDEPVDDLAMAERLLSTTEARYRGLPAKKRRQRLIALLRRRGFSWDVARRALAGQAIHRA